MGFTIGNVDKAKAAESPARNGGVDWRIFANGNAVPALFITDGDSNTTRKGITQTSVRDIAKFCKANDITLDDVLDAMTKLPEVGKGEEPSKGLAKRK